ncbi:glycosyltransferase family 2 protein [Paraliomyxa miuraensis]|uniref:glycosyltransferase family 2 protein n=1 Tax=Paraliomyxa miuraensis TaxID=376150 RepID=UPI002258C7F8|nr:glycosyltransferase family 2 protein [Paraliomyxa miuraensis]MCX4244484.1 glycosyltransferase family 2 protein [Paraliomyxa miuraensis]
MESPTPEISAVVPVFNEVDSLEQMHHQLTEGLRTLGRSYEILFVNDGSTDGSTDKLEQLADRDPQHVRVVHFRKNFGKSPALNAAFERVRGRIVLTLDADLQDDPAMIPEFVERIEAGADLVSGWKKRRHDPLGKTAPSKVFNWVVRRVSGVQLMDFNCGFKAYRIECIRELSVYGGFHRFLPVLAGWKGFVVEQLVVQHRARQHGVSKFGVGRFFDGFLDLLTVLMVTRYRTRPLHFFGVLGAGSGGVGLLLLVYLSILWFLGESIGNRPLLTLGVLLTLAAIQFIGIGLVSELLVRTTITPQEVFSIKSTRGCGEDDVPSRPSARATEPVPSKAPSTPAISNAPETPPETIGSAPGSEVANA